MSTTARLFTLGSSGTGSIATSTTSANADISASLTGSEDTIRLVAIGADVFVRLTNGAGTAVTTDLLIKTAASAEKFSVPRGVTHINAVAATGTGTLNWAISKGA